jgi:proteasome accessory factor A
MNWYILKLFNSFQDKIGNYFRSEDCSREDNLTLNMWQGVEQEYASSSIPIELFEALGTTGVFVFRPDDGIPRAFLQNGGLCYIHSNLFEVCTPECRNPVEVVAYDKACEAYARLASWTYEKETDEKVHFYKANIASDPKGEARYTTVGSHENYLVDRISYFENLYLLVPYIILRQVFVGAGGFVDGEYLLSPRTIFPRKLFSETSSDYPILSTRDESHSDEKFTRAHFVNGEGARSEYTTFLKHSITSYVLKAIECGYLRSVPEIESPIESNKEISFNLEGDWILQLKNGETISVVDYLNTYYLDSIEKLFSNNSPREQDNKALRIFKWALDKLDMGLIEDLDTSIEWVIKKKLAERAMDYQVEDGLSNELARTTILNQYMAVTDSLYYDLVEENKVKTIVSEKDIEKAFLDPPFESRGALRVALAKEFLGVIKTISWSYLKLSPGIRYEPYEFNNLGGWTKEKVQKMIDEVGSNI